MHPPTCYKPEWRYKLHIGCLHCKSLPLLENPTFTRFIWAAQRILRIHLNRKQMVSESWNEEGKGRSWTSKLKCITLSESYHGRFFHFWRQGIAPIRFVSCYASKKKVLKMFLRDDFIFLIWEMLNNKLQRLAFLLWLSISLGDGVWWLYLSFPWHDHLQNPMFPHCAQPWRLLS